MLINYEQNYFTTAFGIFTYRVRVYRLLSIKQFLHACLINLFTRCKIKWFGLVLGTQLKITKIQIRLIC